MARCGSAAEALQKRCDVFGIVDEVVDVEQSKQSAEVVNHGILSAVHQEMSSIPHLEKPPMEVGQTLEVSWSSC